MGCWGKTKLFDLIRAGEFESFLDGTQRRITVASIRARLLMPAAWPPRIVGRDNYGRSRSSGLRRFRLRLLPTCVECCNAVPIHVWCGAAFSDEFHAFPVAALPVFVPSRTTRSVFQAVSCFWIGNRRRAAASLAVTR
jgi:hypothetical protein